MSWKALWIMGVMWIGVACLPTLRAQPSVQSATPTRSLYLPLANAPGDATATATATATAAATATATATIPTPPTATPTALPTSLPGAAIVVDHTSVDLFDRIPDQYVAAARALRMVFMDRSVGQNTSEALDCLAVANWYDSPASCRRDYDSNGAVRTFTRRDYESNQVPARILFDPRGGAFSRANWVFELFADDWQKMTRDFIALLDSGALPGSYDVYAFQFSYLNVEPGSTIADQPGGFFADNPGDANDVYDMERRLARRPDRVFVYWTTSLARGIGSEEATRFNEQMRQFARANGKVLFDFADIEAHDDRGVPCYDNRDGVAYCTPAGQCENYPDDGVNWPAICQDYTTETDGGHLGSVSAGKIRVAKGLWVLMARLAGWDGN